MSMDAGSPPAQTVTVVIPTYNRGPELMRALDALARQTAGVPHVIVVDNASADDTEARVRARMASWPARLQYFRKEPRGPAAARNHGLARVETPCVLFQDSDVELEASWLHVALSHLGSEPELAAVGGLVLYAFDPGQVNAYGGDLGRFGLAWDAEEGTPLDRPRSPQRRIWINTSALLARREVLADVGGFDERYFYGFEDSDLGWRLNLAGHGVAVFPDLRLLHHVNADPGLAHPEMVFHYCKNRLNSVLRNASPASLLQMLPAYAAYTLVDLLLRKPRQAKLRALWWNLKEWPTTRALRRATQAQRKRSDADIFKLGEGRWLPATRLGNQRRRGTAPLGDTDTQGTAPGRQVDDRV